MIFESLFLLLCEFVDSDVGVETAFHVHLTESLDLVVGLLFVVLGVMETNLLEVMSAPRVKVSILGHEITHAKTVKSPWAETSIKRGVKFARTFQPVSWKNGIVILLLATGFVGGEQIDRADTILCP